MNIIKNIDKMWDFMYIASMEYLYTEISQEELSELTLSDRDYIKIIYQLKNPKISEIAEKMGYTKTSVTIMVTKLEKKGYMKRIKSKTDKREISVQLTKKGLFLFRWKEQMYNETLKEIKEVLSDEELENLDILLEKIGKKIDERVSSESIQYDANNLIIPTNLFKYR
ncbi:DNA-binding MarR family transcriptional regulator [Methanococcus maripaludis]|uniref:DNA-binding MarR family transcriptional regulator n=1 Tax=Methanococcus maripaludis TaxID=39152 RepID=A0A7J9P1T1_METMI|nr:MarR family transcriptional regulator [Methanococcus maripaludis]MBA2840982.1 DNA-binding MarR family transcriptional regulator [Methanococcus maripaludis]MBA2853537.1 DNA-binding MarR family transcriptional regulator [Methanococcus maripaludis]MBA2868809.1 DNA-binding MarR family transcriptional regulator [Methanococcus maripaludis]